jgi:hypothetical protein
VLLHIIPFVSCRDCSQFCVMRGTTKGGATERVSVAVTLLTRIREVLGSNLDWDTTYPGSFRGFSYGSVRVEPFTAKSFPVMFVS